MNTKDEILDALEGRFRGDLPPPAILTQTGTVHLYYELLKRYKRGLRSAPPKIREPMFRLGRALRFSEGILNR